MSRLALESVLGLSINALTAADTGCFAFAAGPTIVLADINSPTRRFFFAKPDSLPAQLTPSYYNPATPTKTTRNRTSKEDSLPGVASLDSSVDHPSQAKSSHRSRSLTSVALSPSGQYLAAGEVCTLVHTRTILDSPTLKAIAFSPDSRWLCSLGDLHDGGLFLWSINPRTGALKLDSSNRCTTADTITWMGSNVITIGTRHVKVWRVERPSSPTKVRRGLESVSDPANASPGPRILTGRNVLLGALKDATFTCAIAITEDAAVLCTQDGYVCLLDDAHRSQRLCQVTKKDYSIACVTLDPSAKVVWLGGKGMDPEPLPLSSLLAAKDPSSAAEQRKSLHVPDERKAKESPSICAICCADNRLVAIDTSRGMSTYKVLCDTNLAPTASAVGRQPAHNSAVMGVVVSSDPTVTDFSFLTYSEKGNILYWSWDGTCTGTCTVSLELPLAPEAIDCNELRIVRYLSTINMLLTGDKNGFLRLLALDGHVEATVKGHDGEIYDLTLHDLDEDQSLAASSGRDRTIQIFRLSKVDCSLEQSLINEHAGSIRQVEFTQGGNFLVSLSSDRTLIIHQRVTRTDDSIAFVSTRTIHFKASPTSMALLPDSSPDLLLSTMDRCLRKISLAEGNTTQTFKTTDSSTGESVILTRMIVGTLYGQPTHATVLAGFSSSDGSIRLYDIDTGSLLASFSAQAAVTDLALVQIPETGGHVKTRLVSTGGNDGTIMLWNLSMPPQDETKHLGGDSTTDLNPLKSKTPSSMRLARRVLSKAEIASFQRSLRAQSDNTPNSSRNLSPSRLRHKPSRYAISDRSEIPATASSEKCSPELAGRDSVRGNRLKRASPPLSPKISLQSRTRRSSMDERQRHAVTRPADNIDAAAKQISNTLQEFRTSMTSGQESLSFSSARDLKRQLQATMDVIVPTDQRSDRGHEQVGTEAFDEYLAAMIDKRLALQFGKEVQTHTSTGSQSSPTP
ncbi:MAG: hypothetical protein Q9169_000269 [Polycauliona sp. 2 TL-2023]